MDLNRMKSATKEDFCGTLYAGSFLLQNTSRFKFLTNHHVRVLQTGTGAWRQQGILLCIAILCFVKTSVGDMLLETSSEHPPVTVPDRKHPLNLQGEQQGKDSCSSVPHFRTKTTTIRADSLSNGIPIGIFQDMAAFA